jgi:hypothetical protein
MRQYNVWYVCVARTHTKQGNCELPEDDLNNDRNMLERF